MQNHLTGWTGEASFTLKLWLSFLNFAKRKLELNEVFVLKKS